MLHMSLYVGYVTTVIPKYLVSEKINVHPLQFLRTVDTQSCTNYQEIKLMTHIIKLLERIIEHRLRKVTNVTENQFIFMTVRLTMRNILVSIFKNKWMCKVVLIIRDQTNKPYNEAIGEDN
jgi:hypothetical protein